MASNSNDNRSTGAKTLSSEDANITKLELNYYKVEVDDKDWTRNELWVVRMVVIPVDKPQGFVDFLGSTLKSKYLDGWADLKLEATKFMIDLDNLEDENLEDLTMSQDPKIQVNVRRFKSEYFIHSNLIPQENLVFAKIKFKNNEMNGKNVLQWFRDKVGFYFLIIFVTNIVNFLEKCLIFCCVMFDLMVIFQAEMKMYNVYGENIGGIRSYINVQVKYFFKNFAQLAFGRGYMNHPKYEVDRGDGNNKPKMRPSENQQRNDQRTKDKNQKQSRNKKSKLEECKEYETEHSAPPPKSKPRTPKSRWNSNWSNND